MKSTRRSFFALLAAPFVAGAALVFAKKGIAKPLQAVKIGDDFSYIENRNLVKVLRQSRHLLQGQDFQPFTDGFFHCVGSRLPKDVSLSGCLEISNAKDGHIYIWGPSKGLVMHYPNPTVDTLSKLDLTPISYFDSAFPSENQ